MGDEIKTQMSQRHTLPLHMLAFKNGMAQIPVIVLPEVRVWISYRLMKWKGRSNWVFWSPLTNIPSETEYHSSNFALETQVILGIREANPRTFCQLIRQEEIGIALQGKELSHVRRNKRARHVVHVWNLLVFILANSLKPLQKHTTHKQASSSVYPFRVSHYVESQWICLHAHLLSFWLINPKV